MDVLLEILEILINALPMGDQLWIVFIFILVLSILVFVHEYGHYKAARMCGVNVKSFSIGFGKELFGWTDKHDTRWKFSLVPLGGYVEMLGQGSEEGVNSDNEHESFANKNVWQRIFIVFAGPLANFLFAYASLMGLFAISGEQVMLPKVGAVISGLPAERAGVLPNDLVQNIDGVEMKSWEQLTETIVASNGNTLTLDVLNTDTGETRNVLLTPELNERTNHFGETVKVPFVGVSPAGELGSVQHGPIGGLVRGFERTNQYIAMTLQAFGKLITGSIGHENLGGPVMIAKMSAKAAETGLYPLIIFMAVISVNLAIINLFPVPVLDGGHLVFYFIEILKGSPVSEKSQEKATQAGFAAIVVLMTLAIGNDIKREVTGYFDEPEEETLEESIEKISPETQTGE
ncbi:MAG: RIP metalloprotease RseP [Pseudomonadota bacterium]|nr:RIP metalloprotease RseP [Pseudomonadota bacterium]